jgi:hypothetical protein
MAYQNPQSAPIEEPIFWTGEGADLGTEPDSGALVRRLTSGPMMNHLIYCEQPYTSPDGLRIAIIRGRDFAFVNDFSLLVGEPDTLKLALVEKSIPRNIAHNSWSEWLYYMTHEGALRRVSLLTLQKQHVLPDDSIPMNAAFASITPDGRQIICHERPAEEPPQIVAYDTESGARSVLFSHPDNGNPHLQVDPIGGKHILMQLITGHAEGKIISVPVFIMDIDGENMRKFPIGGKHTSESTGHMAWITGTDRVAVAVEWNRAGRTHDPRHSHGNLVMAGIDDTEPTIFKAPDRGFYHVSVSRCGTYFVADEFMDAETDVFRRDQIGPVRIVVGNIELGKYDTLIHDCRAYGIAGTSNWEPCPYFTADNRWVIYNSSPFGVNQVHAARVPEEFLAGLA